MPPGVRFNKNPSNKGEVSSGTVSSVKVNSKQIAVLGSMVKTCSDPMDQENSVIIAMGAAVKMPILVPGMDPNFTNKGGAVMNTREPIAKQGSADAKTPKITKVKWSSQQCKSGEKVKLMAQLSDQYENANVYFTIWAADADREKDAPEKRITGQNKGGSAEVEWTYFPQVDPRKPPEKKPKFVAAAISYKCEEQDSGALEWFDDIKVKLVDSFGTIMKDQSYELLYCDDGNHRKGKSNSEGVIEEKKVIPGQVITLIYNEDNI